jgi:hypothetical protein
VSGSEPATAERRPGRRRRTAVAVVVVLAVGLLAWLLLRSDDSASPESGAPRAADVQQLRALSASVGHPVYWAGGPAAGTELELTHQADGRIYVRYLSDGAEVGDERAGFTTVGTYPVPGAFAALGKAAKQPAAIVRDLPGGGLAYMSSKRPTSVYLAWPGSDYEVEVFDPSPKHALDLVLRGKVAPLG